MVEGFQLTQFLKKTRLPLNSNARVLGPSGGQAQRQLQPTGALTVGGITSSHHFSPVQAPTSVISGSAPHLGAPQKYLLRPLYHTRRMKGAGKRSSHLTP